MQSSWIWPKALQTAVMGIAATACAEWVSCVSSKAAVRLRNASLWALHRTSSTPAVFDWGSKLPLLLFHFFLAMSFDGVSPSSNASKIFPSSSPTQLDVLSPLSFSLSLKKRTKIKSKMKRSSIIWKMSKQKCIHTRVRTHMHAHTNSGNNNSKPQPGSFFRIDPRTCPVGWLSFPVTLCWEKTDLGNYMLMYTFRKFLLLPKNFYPLIQLHNRTQGLDPQFKKLCLTWSLAVNPLGQPET